MRRATAIFAALLIAAVGAWPESLGQQSATELQYEEAIGRAQEYAEKGLLDKAVLLLEDTADRLVSAGDRARAAQSLLAVAGLYRELGNRQAFLDRLFRASHVATGTDQQSIMATHYRLAIAQLAIDEGNLANALETLGDVFEHIGNVPANNQRRNLESIALTLRVQVQLRAAMRTVDGESVSAGELASDRRRLLSVLLSSDVTFTPSRAVGNPVALDKRRPWRRTILEVALALNERVTALDRTYSQERIRELEVAKDRSLRGTILGYLGRFDEAIAIKRETLAVFDRQNALDDSLVDLDNLCDLFIEKRDPIQALPYSIDLIRRIEGQTLVQVGQTTVGYLDRYRPSYLRHARLLWTQYQALRKIKHMGADAALGAFLIHVDRLNLRGPRRDMAVYHDLGGSIGHDAEMLTRLDTALSMVSDAQEKVAQAIADQRHPSDFEPAPGIQIDSPFGMLASARQDFITAIENIKRKETRSINVDPNFPENMQDVVSGMSRDDAILMFFLEPNGAANVALITSSYTQLVPLGSIAEELGKLRDTLQRHVSVDPEPTLARLSTLLVARLPPLPKRVTIVMSDLVMGVPFDALRTSDGALLAIGHSFRYAYGLYPKVGAPSPHVVIKRAMIVGADQFRDGALAPLPQSRQEIYGIRELLGKRAVEIVPVDAFPSSGHSLLQQEGSLQVIHVSTHSRLDSATPMLDALVFPSDSVYAHQLAMSGLRSSLVVLSACELNLPRGDRMYPVSGITSAALGRIAPQVISPVWEVNASATQIFMLRFYDELVESGDAAAALAVVKREFADGRALREWLVATGLSENVSDADIEEYRRPYYWAPFVLTVRATDASGAIN